MHYFHPYSTPISGDLDSPGRDEQNPLRTGHHQKEARLHNPKSPATLRGLSYCDGWDYTARLLPVLAMHPSSILWELRYPVWASIFDHPACYNTSPERYPLTFRFLYIPVP